MSGFTLLSRDGDYSNVDIRPIGSYGNANYDGQEKETLEQRFKRLCGQWKQETSHVSVLQKRYRHPAYGEILAMKKDAIPLILAEMRREPDWWFHALETLTKRNPAAHADNFYEGVDDWISWGIAQELIE